MNTSGRFIPLFLALGVFGIVHLFSFLGGNSPQKGEQASLSDEIPAEVQFAIKGYLKEGVFNEVQDTLGTWLTAFGPQSGKGETTWGMEYWNPEPSAGLEIPEGQDNLHLWASLHFNSRIDAFQWIHDLMSSPLINLRMEEYSEGVQSGTVTAILTMPFTTGRQLLLRDFEFNLIHPS